MTSTVKAPALTWRQIAEGYDTCTAENADASYLYVVREVNGRWTALYILHIEDTDKDWWEQPDPIEYFIDGSVESAAEAKALCEQHYKQHHADKL